jgi:FkbM family methyltransferase
MKVWQRILGPGDVFVDVGANIGLYAVVAAEQGARVIAVEPQPAAVAQLERNLAINGFSAHVHRVALADRAGEMVLSGRDGNQMALVVDSAAVGGVSVHTETVRVTTLDDLVGEQPVAGLKIDVEGAERLVLEGARRLLSRGLIALIQLEWNSRSLDTLGESRNPVAVVLEEFGYSLARPGDDGTLMPLADWGFGDDVFAIRASLGH